MRADRAHDDVAAHPGRLRGLDELHRGAEVDGLLALGPAAGPRARGEHDRVRAAHGVAQVVGRLHVEHDRLAPVRLDVGDVVGVADDPANPVAAAREQARQMPGDLAVRTGDDDVHGAIIAPRADAACHVRHTN